MKTVQPTDPRVQQPTLTKATRNADKRQNPTAREAHRGSSRSRALAVHQPAPLPPAKTVDEQILRAAADPAVDVAKMRELTTLRRQLRMEEAEEQFNIAMRECQEEMRPVEADAKNDHTKSKYATLGAVEKALRPIYTKHGFSLSFNTADSPLPDHIRVLCYVSRDLFTRTYQHDVAIDATGPKGGNVMNKTHARNSGLSYGKRTLELSIFHVTVDQGVDDDGNKAAGLKEITPAQKNELAELIKRAGANVEGFCELFAIQAIDDLPASHFGIAKTQLNMKIKRQQQKQPAGEKGGML